MAWGCLSGNVMQQHDNNQQRLQNRGGPLLKALAALVFIEGAKALIGERPTGDIFGILAAPLPKPSRLIPNRTQIFNHSTYPSHGGEKVA